MEISRTQWDAVASFSILMHSVFYTEENASDGVLTIDHVIEKGWLQPVFDSGLTLEKLKDYMEYVVKKGGGTEYGSNLSHYIPDFKLILERFETVKKKVEAQD